MKELLLVGLAGMTGTMLRYWLTGVFARRYGESFPIGTFFVNVVGCFLAGFLFHLMHERAIMSETARAVALTGLLGGLTTFSAYSLQSFLLMREGNLWLALIYLFASNAAGLLRVLAGYTLARLF